MNPYFDSFLNYIRCERNYSDYTVAFYADDLERYETFVTEQTGEFDVLRPDVDLVRAWMVEMGEQGLAVSSIKRRTSAVRSFYRYLRRQRLIDTDPMALLSSPRVPKPLPVWVSEGQMDQLIDEFDFGDDFEGQRDRLLITMLYSTGMRRSEAAGLRNVDVDMAACQLRVMGKGRKERLIPFGSELKQQLGAYMTRRDAEVPETDGHLLVKSSGKPLTPNDVTSIAHRYMQTIPTLARKGAHVLRHSFATNMLANGAGLMAVKELLGHASLQSTQVYTHLTPKDLLENYKQAHPRGK